MNLPNSIEDINSNDLVIFSSPKTLLFDYI